MLNYEAILLRHCYKRLKDVLRILLRIGKGEKNPGLFIGKRDFSYILNSQYFTLPNLYRTIRAKASPACLVVP